MPTSFGVSEEVLKNKSYFLKEFCFSFGYIFTFSSIEVSIITLFKTFKNVIYLALPLIKSCFVFPANPLIVIPISPSLTLCQFEGVVNASMRLSPH
ncbi:hypothetical protein BXP23_08165 [Helicobacter pylori]|nr:hypothetical protein BXP01_08160 [Helicobacter pylori]QDY57035.1 hypothetical protein CV725_08195 [Helicobacter pylori B128]AVG80455.1 hypothetical protein BXP12_08165 [Helicobacter pylori]AVG81937.1 hypothetical protein BXP17_08160 [Helicobacter pylori]AVG83308.1 hypothetical protein BXP20_08205 [Helicobacter pylori]